MNVSVLSVEVAPTLADHVAYNEYILGRPDVRTRRVVITLAAFLLGPPIGLVLGFLLGYGPAKAGQTAASDHVSKPSESLASEGASTDGFR